jgi:hypothetical protein
MKGIQILMIIIFFLTEILQSHLLLNLMKNMVMSNEDKKKYPKYHG